MFQYTNMYFLISMRDKYKKSWFCAQCQWNLPDWCFVKYILVFISHALIDLVNKHHNAPITYPIMHHFVSEMCIYIYIYSQNGTLWDICLMYCGICEMGPISKKGISKCIKIKFYHQYENISIQGGYQIPPVHSSPICECLDTTHTRVQCGNLSLQMTAGQGHDRSAYRVEGLIGKTHSNKKVYLWTYWGHNNIADILLLVFHFHVHFREWKIWCFD